MQHRNLPWQAVVCSVGFFVCLHSPLQATENECPKDPQPLLPKVERSDVYRDTPFKAGEKAEYEVTYATMNLLAGYGYLEVKSPQIYQGAWHRVFHGEAKTGDWFKTIYVVHDVVEAKSRPADFGISQFFMEQNEGKLIGRTFVQKKWLEFDHGGCKVKEKTSQPEKSDEQKEFFFMRGGVDALGAVYQLRTFNYKAGKKERVPVYTSEQNWWLEAEPLAVENITVPAGKFRADKLKLQTYLGKELQQKGNVFIWIGKDAPRPLVQVQGDIRIGSLLMQLKSLTVGS